MKNPEEAIEEASAVAVFNPETCVAELLNIAASASAVKVSIFKKKVCSLLNDCIGAKCYCITCEKSRCFQSRTCN